MSTNTGTNTATNTATTTAITTTSLSTYIESLSPQQISAAEAASESAGMVTLLQDFKITSKDSYAEIATIVQEVKAKLKFLDDERKITVTPLNNEVKRVNDWYRPALDSFKLVVERGLRLMADFDLAQRKEEQRLLIAAQAEAAKQAAAQAAVVQAATQVAQVPSTNISAANTTVTTSIVAATEPSGPTAQQLVQQAAQANAPTVAGITAKHVFVWSVKDLLRFVRNAPSFTCTCPTCFGTGKMPDQEKLDAHVATNGLNNVPAGIEVTEDVKHTVRQARR